MAVLCLFIATVFSLCKGTFIYFELGFPGGGLTYETDGDARRLA